jgi:hypothetical protein
MVLTSPTSGGRSVGIVRLRNTGTEFSFFSFIMMNTSMMIEYSTHGIYETWVQNFVWLSDERDLFRYIGVYGRILRRCDSNRVYERELHLRGFEQGPVACSCEHGMNDSTPQRGTESPV